MKSARLRWIVVAANNHGMRSGGPEVVIRCGVGDEVST